MCGILEANIDVLTEPGEHSCKTHKDANGAITMKTADYTVKIYQDEDEAKRAWLAARDAQAAELDAIISGRSSRS